MILQILKNTSNWKLNSTVHDWKNFLSANQIRYNCLSIAQYSCYLINFILFLIHKKCSIGNLMREKMYAFYGFMIFCNILNAYLCFIIENKDMLLVNFFVTNPFVKKHYWAIDFLVIFHTSYRFLQWKLSKI